MKDDDLLKFGLIETFRDIFDVQVIGRWPNYIFSIKLAKTLYVEFTNTE